MVYCGKPSKGCQECRDRKTRCDRVTPSCTQCIRAKRQCTGYRDPLDLIFRNESDQVAVKAKAKEKLKQKSKSPSPNPVQRESEEPYMPPRENEVLLIAKSQASDYRGQFSQALLPKFTMFPTVEERGLSTFGMNAPSWFVSGDILECAPNPVCSDEHLLASMSAVGLASFSTSIRAPELMVRARRDYVNALQLTNAALRSPTEVKKDSTLFAVMILGIFETVSGNTERSLAAWAEHVNGAAALIKLRGPEQLNSNAGKTMFFQVAGNLMLSCIQRCTPMPEHIVELSEIGEREGLVNADNPAWQMSKIVIDFTILRSAVREGKITEPRDIIEAAIKIDQRFITVTTNLPPDWSYETVYTDENPELIWNSMYHVYKDHTMARIFNVMRTSRILVHELIRDQLLSTSTSIAPIFTEAETATRLQDSVNVMLQMRTEILASIPQHTPSILNSNSSSILEGSRVYFVLWPLYLVGVMDLTTNAIRNWAIARLRDIGETMGLRQALVVADLMSSGTQPEAWKTTSTRQVDKVEMDIETIEPSDFVED